MNARPVASCVLALLMAGSLIHGCKKNQDSGASALGEDAGPNACTLTNATLPVLGPMEFQRSKGKPVTKTTGFDIPIDGDICVSVTNGLHDPPHGHRVSSAWIRIDGIVVFGPDSFSQVTAGINQALPIKAGAHELSVELASKPGSFLTVEIRLLAEDNEPPEVAIEPADGSTVSTDTPIVRIGYTDAGVGVNPSSFSVFLNGVAVTARFSVNETEAIWQVDINSYLEEGVNEIVASIDDWRENTGTSVSVFQVHTPTDALLLDLESDNPEYRKRSAYKLIDRTDEFAFPVLRRCLKQLFETPEPKAVDRMLILAQSENIEHISRALSAGAIGEASRIDPATGQRPDVVDVLGNMMMRDPSYVAKLAAVRAMGQTKNELALSTFEDFVENRFVEPKEPEICSTDPDNFDCGAYFIIVALVALEAGRAIVRIAGQDYQIGNPGDLMAFRAKYLEVLQTYMDQHFGNGGQP